MKNTLLTVFLFLCLCGRVSAQNADNAAIKGIVVDSLKNQPMGYVTVALIDGQNGKAVKSTFTKDNGSFELTGLAVKPYKLTLVFVGYASKTINIPNVVKGTDLGRIMLSTAANQLKDVSVTAVKPLMKREVDRLTYDVQADPENKVISVLDMMRRVPLLSVDATDNIKLQGNSNYKILINGKPSALVAQNPADVLKSMPASNIQKIEVITTPPAKYDAEGLAGIINIITKKDIDQGYNGSINGRYSNLFGTGTNLNLTVKQGKLGVGGYFGYTQQNTLTTGFRNLNDIFGQSLLMQSGSRTNTGRNMYSSAELSYEVDTLNLFTASFEQYSGGNDFNNSQLSQQTSAVALNNRSYQSANGGKNNYSGFGLGTNYQLGFKRDKEQLLTASYKYNQSGGKLFNDINFLNRANFNNPNYKQYNNSGSNEHTLQLDYVHPVKKWLIEAGTKAIFRKNYSNYNTDTLQAGASKYVTDQNQTNEFDYLQNVYSLYNSYQLKLTKWVLKGGMRLERTTINAYGSAQVQPYSNLVPSFSVQRSFTSSSLNLGYTDRIQRPGISELNPFYDRSNINFRNIGNPNLRPVVSHNVELNYSNFKKGSLNVGLNYRFANNTIESVVSSSGADAVSITTYQNVGKNKGLGIDVNVSYPITSKFNVNMNAELLHVWLRGVYNNQFFNARGYQGHTFGNAGYKFENGYRLGASLDFDSRYVLLQGRDNFYLGYSFSSSKEFLNKKASVSLSLSNPFNKFRKIDFFTRTADFYQFTATDNYARRLNISVMYKFGKLNSDLKKNSRGISNDDVSGGRRN